MIPVAAFHKYWIGVHAHTVFTLYVVWCFQNLSDTACALSLIQHPPFAPFQMCARLFGVATYPLIILFLFLFFVCLFELKVMRVFWGPDSCMFDMDPFCVPLRFNEEQFSPSAPKVKVGWFVSDGFFDACKATARAVELSKLALTRAGYELVEFKVPDPEEYVTPAHTRTHPRAHTRPHTQTYI